MKIKIESTKGKILGLLDIDLKSTVAKAETEGDHDPVSNAASIVEKQIKNRGLDVKSEELLNFQSMLSKALSKGRFPSEFKMKGKKIRNMFNKNTKNSPSSSDLLLEGVTDVFETIIEYPNEQAEEEYKTLIGLDDIKERLTKEGSLLLSTGSLEKWSKKHYKNKIISACSVFEKRLPLIVFGGDIGTGKTALAESFGDPMAKLLRTKIFLLRISVQTRGTGLVGEMTQLINKAFREAKRVAEESESPVILLVDEADTLAQSREAIHMHHEDKAGVNALIQGIDHIKAIKPPILVVFCTNRLDAIDPAIIRRAAIVHKFARPNNVQLGQMFSTCFSDIDLTKQQIEQLVALTSPTESRKYGFTYSDIVNKVVPSAIMKAYPDTPLTFKCILSAVQETQPTPPFKENYESK